MNISVKLIAGLACLSLALHSCDKESLQINKVEDFNKEFGLKLNELASIKDSTSHILVQVKNISDLRCKNHLTCADPGSATVRLWVSNDKNSNAETMLYLDNLPRHSGSADSVTLHMDNQNYTFRLHQVNPHPVNTNLETQTVKLSVLPKRIN